LHEHESYSQFFQKRTFFVLNLLLDVVNGIGRLNFKSYGLPSQGFDENLHSSTKSEHKMKSGFLLDVVVAQGASIFQLLSSKDETLLVWRNSCGTEYDVLGIVELMRDD